MTVGIALKGAVRGGEDARRRSREEDVWPTAEERGSVSSPVFAFSLHAAFLYTILGRDARCVSVYSKRKRERCRHFHVFSK